MNSDFKDIPQSLNERGIKYLIIGGYAVSYYADRRYTKDINILVEASVREFK